MKICTERHVFIDFELRMKPCSHEAMKI